MQRPWYVLFAGVNGAGKSTLYQTDMWRHGHEGPELQRVNSDEILVAQGGDWHSQKDQIHAGREAVRLVHQYLSGGVSFNQETTLAGKTIIGTVKRAHELGFHVVMHYVGVEDVSIANARIAHRTLVGGHGIDPGLVESRWHASLRHLHEVLPLCDEAYLYDNTERLRLLARLRLGELLRVYPQGEGITWYESVLQGISVTTP